MFLPDAGTFTKAG